MLCLPVVVLDAFPASLSNRRPAALMQGTKRPTLYDLRQIDTPARASYHNSLSSEFHVIHIVRY